MAVENNPSNKKSVQFSKFSRIGLFDSGVGGLSVLNQLTRMPGSVTRNFFYVADTLRCPYGNRSVEELSDFVTQIVSFLIYKNVDALVIACNTSAANALEHARKISPVPVYDLIAPTAQQVSAISNKIGVMATQATINSHAFKNAINSYNAKAEVVEVACPDLVPIVESARVHEPKTYTVLQKYIDVFRARNVDTLILGCTHFPFLRRPIEELCDGKITLIDPAESLALSLSATSSQTDQRKQHFTNFFTTGSKEQFSNTASRCLGYALNGQSRIEEISIGDLIGTVMEQQADRHESGTMTSPAVPIVVQ